MSYGRYFIHFRKRTINQSNTPCFVEDWQINKLNFRSNMVSDSPINLVTMTSSVIFLKKIFSLYFDTKIRSSNWVSWVEGLDFSMFQVNCALDENQKRSIIRWMVRRVEDPRPQTTTNLNPLILITIFF